MLTGQNYAGDSACPNPNEPTVPKPAPTVEIPAHLLNHADNWQITQALRLAQDPTTTDINRDLVLAAINAAFTLGTHQMPKNSRAILLPLFISRPSVGSQMSAFEIVLEALTAYRRSMAEMRTSYGLEVIEDIDHVQSEMMEQLYQITTNLIG